MFIPVAAVLVIVMPTAAPERITPDDAVDALRSARRDERLRATAVCGVLKVRRAVEPLKKLLETETDDAVRAFAAMALLAIQGKDKDLVELLRKQIKSDDKTVREVAASYCIALAEKGLPLLEVLCDGFPKDRVTLHPTMLHFTNEDVVFLITYLKAKNNHIREQACSTASFIQDRARKLDAKVLSALAELLSDRNGADEDAAKALAHCGKPAVTLLRRPCKATMPTRAGWRRTRSGGCANRRTGRLPQSPN